MKTEEINKAIAEACGKNRYEPNYCTNLNAMHGAWQKLNRKQRIEFSIRLRIVVVDDGGHATSFNEDIVACVENATARQRAEAFLRTVGKWVE